MFLQSAEADGERGVKVSGGQCGVANHRRHLISHTVSSATTHFLSKHSRRYYETAYSKTGQNYSSAISDSGTNIRSPIPSNKFIHPSSRSWCLLVSRDKPDVGTSY